MNERSLIGGSLGKRCHQSAFPQKITPKEHSIVAILYIAEDSSCYNRKICHPKKNSCRAIIGICHTARKLTCIFRELICCGRENNQAKKRRKLPTCPRIAVLQQDELLCYTKKLTYMLSVIVMVHRRGVSCYTRGCSLGKCIGGNVIRPGSP